MDFSFLHYIKFTLIHVSSGLLGLDIAFEAHISGITILGSANDITVDIRVSLL